MSVHSHGGVSRKSSEIICPLSYISVTTVFVDKNINYVMCIGAIP